MCCICKIFIVKFIFFKVRYFLFLPWQITFNWNPGPLTIIRFEIHLSFVLVPSHNNAPRAERRRHHLANNDGFPPGLCHCCCGCSSSSPPGSQRQECFVFYFHVSSTRYCPQPASLLLGSGGSPGACRPSLMSHREWGEKVGGDITSWPEWKAFSFLWWDRVLDSSPAVGEVRFLLSQVGLTVGLENNFIC